MERVRNKVALVTGAAKGIGRATAILLAEEGAKVVLTDVDDAAGESVAKEIRDAGGNAIFFHHDVTDEVQWVKVIQSTQENFGALNILVNNAGMALDGNAEHETLERWRQLMAVNLDGVFLGTKHAIAAMKTGNGSIINLSSVEGIVADPNLAAYNASKGGVRLFSKSAALYCAREQYQIRVNTVHPGYIWTPMVENFLASLGDLKATRPLAEKLHPIGRLGDPKEIAYAILYLASDEALFVTGSELVIDGGYTAQ